MPDEWQRSSASGHLDALLGLLQRYTPSSTSAPEGPVEDQGNDPPRKRRVILRSEKEAADGHVTAVQAALRSGWRLVDIELREGEKGKRRLAFVLQQTRTPTRHSG